MKRSTSLCILLALAASIGDSFGSVTKPPAPPVDTTIRVLLVADERLDPADVTAARMLLVNTWNNTSFSTATATTITIADTISASESVFLDEDDEPLGPDEHIESLRQFVESPSPPLVDGRREIYAADVVVGLSSEIEEVCGTAPQDNWLGIFPSFDDSGPHDLREANDDYIAVAQLSGSISCQPYLAAHEFGHLLGGGHRDSIHNFNGGLLANSKALGFVDMPGPRSRHFVTAMGHGPESVDCPRSSILRCIHIPEFSDYDGYGDDDHRNAEALQTTARSVANYRTGPGMPAPPAMCSDGIDNDGDNLVDSADPDCAVCSQELCPVEPNPPPGCDATIRPFGMTGWITQLCYPDPTGGTAYQVVWSHACPQEVSFYEVWAAQPTSSPFTFRWSVVPPFSTAVVIGAAARVKVRSCGTGGCSALSTSSFLAIDRC